jgi:hypothetical protein
MVGGSIKQNGTVNTENDRRAKIQHEVHKN